MSQSSSPVRRFTRLVAVAALCALGLAVQPALAQQTQPAQPVAPAQPAAPAQIPANQIPIILGILDSGKAGNTCTAGKSLSDQANAALNQIESDFRKKEQVLQQQMQQLMIARSANPPMAPADFEAKRKALYDQDQQLQDATDKAKQALGARVDKARAKIADAMQKIVIDMAKQRGLTLVIERNAAHLFVPQWDLTPEVLTRLNKALPSIKL